MTHRTTGILLIAGAAVVIAGGIYWWKSGTRPMGIFRGDQSTQDSSSPSPSLTPEPNPHRIQGWIGEGIPVIKATKKANIPIYQDPGDTQSIGTIPVENGETITWSESEVIVREKGTLAFNSTKTVPVFEYPLLNGMPVTQSGTPREQSFETGKSVDYLTPRAEGALVIYVNGTYLELDGTDTAISITKEPVTEFWVYDLVTKDAGAWIKVDNDILKITSRRF